jgi:hypothetical protein
MGLPLKIKVYQWQYDDIEAAIWSMKDSRKWLDENLEVAKYSFPADLPYVYIFFGPENRMVEWSRFLGFEHRDVRHALRPDKIEGLRGIPVRIYDKTGDKTWYHQNYWLPEVQRTLGAMNQMSSNVGRLEKIE